MFAKYSYLQNISCMRYR